MFLTKFLLVLVIGGKKMYDILKHSPQVNPLSEELKLPGTKDDLVILIHGYTGSPRDMVKLGKSIHSKYDYTVIVPRLPGHGTDYKDFLNTSKNDWLRKIYDLIINHEQTYDDIHLIGLSMGALISLLSSLHFRIKSLILISPALYAENKSIIFSHILKYILPFIPKKFEVDSDIKDPNLIDLLKNYNSKTFIKQVAELHKLMLECRKRLSDITVPIKIVHSLKDNVVPVKSANQIYEQVSSTDKELTILENSPHVINYGPEKDKLFNEVVSFLKEI